MHIPEIEDIYFSKTREYFNEVLSSYANGNYRSAVVMLYSVAICDLLFKLQELKETYDDAVAESVLSKVEKCRSSLDNKSKSKWEKELVDLIYEKTELLALEEYTNLNHLYDHRNFSAHPALNSNYELIAPSRESTIAHIRNTLEGILVKPPIFIKNITEMMTEDLSVKRELYEDHPERLSNYINMKYLSKMSLTMRKSVFKNYWKFCFCLPEDDDCQNNRKINRRILGILYSNNSTEIIEYMKHEVIFQNTSHNEECIKNLCIFLAEFPDIYAVLSDDSKFQLKSLIDKSYNAKAISWFCNKDKKEHIAEVIHSKPYEALQYETIEFIANQYDSVGLWEIFIEFCIEYFGESCSYDAANSRFEIAIQPYLNRMNKDQYISIIEKVNSNCQIYDRRSAYYSNNSIIDAAKDFIPKTFSFDAYRNFKFDKEYLYSPKDSTETSEEEEDTNSIEF